MTANERIELTAGDEAVLRVLNAEHLKNGQVYYRAFRLSSADERSGHLSVSQAKKTTAHSAFRALYESKKSRAEENGKEFSPPVGVGELTVEDIRGVQVDKKNVLSVWDDSMNDDVPDDHAYIDFNDVPASNKGRARTVAKMLAARANRRKIHKFPAGL